MWKPSKNDSSIILADKTLHGEDFNQFNLNEKSKKSKNQRLIFKINDKEYTKIHLVDEDEKGQTKKIKYAREVFNLLQAIKEWTL